MSNFEGLESVQHVKIVDLISEGEIEGLVNGNKSIFIDGTPLFNERNEPNFGDTTEKDLQRKIRFGTSDQKHIKEFPEVASTTLVNVKVDHNAPVTRRITNLNVDQVRITLTFPALFKIENDDIKKRQVTYSITRTYKNNNVTVNSETFPSYAIKGKTQSSFQRDHLINIDTISDTYDAVDLTVTKITDDDDLTENPRKRFTEFFFSQYVEIINEKMRYPHSALVALRLNAKSFNSIPQRKYEIKGIKVKIPSIIVSGAEKVEVDSTTGRIIYPKEGFWNGTFQLKSDGTVKTIWTSDPAWCLYDLLTNTRYGAGIPESSLDKFDFFQISKYCSAEIVDESNDPRFSLNILINSRKEIYNVISELTAVFRGIAYYGAGSLVLLQDKPADAQYLIGQANVVEGLFTYTGTSHKARHTVACVAWQSYDMQGEVQYEYVEDQDAIEKYGIIKKDIKSIGCYSQKQAQRLGRWTLLSEQNLTETCQFAISIDSGIILRPGMVIDIADPSRAGSRRSGRINTATSTVVTIDSAQSLSVDQTKSPKLSVLLPTGLVETRNILSISNNAISVVPGFSQTPPAGAVYMIETTDLQVQKFRVLSVVEQGDGVYGVSAIAYNESIYDAADKDKALTERNITSLNAVPTAPSGLAHREYLYQEGQTVHTGCDISWEHDRVSLSRFLVKYSIDESNARELFTDTPNLTLRDLKKGQIDIEITAINYLGKKSTTLVDTFNINGKTAKPGDVQNLSIEPISANTARLRWDETVDLDVKVNGKVHIRHNNKTDGTATWQNSTDLVKAVPGSSTETTVPLIEGEILVKFEDEIGEKSNNETSVIVDLPDALGRLLVETHREDTTSTPFNGTKTNCEFDSSLNGLIISSSNGNVLTSAEYIFPDTLDLGGAFSLDLERHFVTQGFYPAGGLFDDRAELIDTWTDFDGTIADAVNAQLYVRSSTNATPTNSDPWRPFASGTFKGRSFQFKAELTSADVAQNIEIDQLGYKATFQRRQDNSNGTIASGTSAKTVTFEKPFFTGLSGGSVSEPSVGITVHNMASGDTVNVDNVTGTGFTVEIKDSNETFVNRNFTYIAVGYGRGV